MSHRAIRTPSPVGAPRRYLSMLVVRTQTAAASIDRGATLVEYAALITLIAIAVFTTLALWGETIVRAFSDTEQAFPENPGSP